MNNVNFFSPFDDESRAIERRRALADALQKQSMQPTEQQTAGGWVIPISPLEGAAKIAQAYAARKMEDRADAQNRALGEKYRSALSDTLMRGQQATVGTPERTIQPDPQEAQQSADYGTPQVGTVNQPAQQPDLGRAASIYMGHPATQQIGLQMATQNASDQRRRMLLAEILKSQGPGAGQQQPQANPMQGGPGASVMAPGGAQPMPQQPQQGALSGVNPQALALALSGDPALEKVGEWQQHSQKPLAVSEGGAVYIPGKGLQFVRPKIGEGMRATGYGPSGELQGVEAIPGYTPALGAIESAKEGAKAGYDLVNVPLPGGGTQQMPRSLAAQRLGGGAVPGMPGAPGAGGGAGAPTGGLGFARPGGNQFAEKVGSEFGELYSNLNKADFNAPQTIAKYDRLGSLLSAVNTGKFTGTTIDIKAAAKSAGFDLGALGITDDIAPAQAARALSNQLALELRNPAGGAGMPGAMSDQDRNFLAQMIPSLENDPGSIGLMIDYRKRIAQREQQVAKMARAYRKKTGVFDEGFLDQLADWSSKNSLFPESSKPHGKGSSGSSGFRVLGVEGR